MSNEIRVERLLAARVFTISSDPTEIVLQVESAAEMHHFTMKIDELGRLARRLTHDAALLSAQPKNSRREAACPSTGLAGQTDPYPS